MHYTTYYLHYTVIIPLGVVAADSWVANERTTKHAYSKVRCVFSHSTHIKKHGLIKKKTPPRFRRSPSLLYFTGTKPKKKTRAKKIVARESLNALCMNMQVPNPAIYIPCTCVLFWDVFPCVCVSLKTEPVVFAGRFGLTGYVLNGTP